MLCSMAFTYTAADLPDGISFDPDTRMLTGTPTTAGEGEITITATGDDGETDTYVVRYAIKADVVPSILPIRTRAFLRDKPIRAIEPRVDDGNPPFSWSASNLPDGLDIDTEMGVISGTPATIGEGNATVMVSDTDGDTATRVFAWRVINM